MNGSKFEMDRPRGSRGAPRGGPRGAPRGMSRGRGGPPGMRGPPVRDSRPPFKDSRGPPMGRESRGPPMRESRGPPRESRGPPMGRGPPRESFGERSSYGGRSSEYKDPYREPLPSRDFGERDRGYSTGGGESYRDYGAPSSRSYLSDHRDRDYPPARDPYGPPSRGDDYGSREYGSSGSRWVSGSKDSRESRFGDSMGGRGDYGGGFSRDLELPPSRSSYEIGHSRDYDSGRGGAYDSYSSAPRGYEGGSRSNGMSSRGPPSRGPPSRGPPARSLMSGSPPRGPPSMRDRRPPREGESRRPPPPRDMEPPMKRPRGDSPPRRGGSSLRSFGGDRGRGGSRGMPRGRGRGAPMGMGGRGRGGRGSPRGMPPRR